MRAVLTNQARKNGLVLTTLLLVLGAESVFFGTLVMSYLFLRAGGSGDGFRQVSRVDFWIALANTLVLVASAVFAWNAARQIARGSSGGLKINLLAALLLGGVFVAGQVFEFNHSGMRIEDLMYGGAFFALISFHAAHVLAGMTVLALNFARASLGDFDDRRHTAISVGTWFWYYVTAVWLALFVVLYLV